MVTAGFNTEKRASMCTPIVSVFLGHQELTRKSMLSAGLTYYRQQSTDGQRQRYTWIEILEEKYMHGKVK